MPLFIVRFMSAMPEALTIWEAKPTLRARQKNETGPCEKTSRHMEAARENKANG